MSYTPKVHDYVRWKTHEGWVYFKCEESISIELGVLDKVCHEHGVWHHKKNHILLVCPSFLWHELEYVKNRREPDVNMYKSQEGRYSDVQ
jgi:hypothetical protein